MVANDMEVSVAVLSKQLETMDERLKYVETQLKDFDKRMAAADLARAEHALRTETMLAEIKAQQELQFAKRDEFTRGAKWSIYIAWIVLTSGALMGAAKLFHLLPKGN